MTKQQALQICYDMWSWLAANPEKEKTDWLTLNPQIEKLNSQCSCCEYVSRLRANTSNGMNCNLCPLVNFWKQHGLSFDIEYRNKKAVYQDYCMSSVYNEWHHSAGNHAQRQRLAELIANAAKHELDLLIPKAHL